jgi:Lon protease-like protein
MPRAHLPVPIFEDQYLRLVSDAIREDVYVGVIQPILDDGYNSRKPLPLFTSGTLGRITEIVEIEEQRVVVNIMGICRFDIEEVTETSAGCRNAQVVYERYLQDLQELKEIQIDRERLLQALDGYFRQYDVAPNWKEIDRTTDAKLIAVLTMVCPFDAREKQALLEAPSLELQSEMITQLIEFANFEGVSPSMTRH